MLFFCLLLLGGGGHEHSWDFHYYKWNRVCHWLRICKAAGLQPPQRHRIAGGHTHLQGLSQPESRKSRTQPSWEMLQAVHRCVWVHGKDWTWGLVEYSIDNIYCFLIIPFWILVLHVFCASEEDFEKLPASTVPEMQRSNLAPVILQLKALGIDNVLRFNFLSVSMPILHTGCLLCLHPLRKRHYTCAFQLAGMALCL